jgi:acetolactate decarboxylase
MSWILPIFIVLLAAEPSASTAPKPYEVHWVGELHKVMMEGEDASVISLDSLDGGAKLYALGPLEGSNGEITVIAGDPLIATIRDGAPHIERSSSVRAPLLVWAEVEAWTPVALPENVKSLEDLDRFVAESAAAAGSGLDAPFPFRVTGRIEKGAMHIVNRQGREAKGHEAHDKIKVVLPVENADVELLGFWSDRHEGVFTHRGSHIHVHGRTVDDKLAGHVDEAVFAAGQLWLPSSAAACH